MKKYTTFTNIRPVSITDHPNQKGYVEIRLRGNLTQINDGDAPTYEYDEYLLIIPKEENLQEKIKNDFDNWFLTGRTLEVNYNSSVVQEMKTGLNILGVNDNSNIVKSAKEVQEKTDTKITGLAAFGKNYITSYMEKTNEAPTPEAGILADTCDPWKENQPYKKNNLFSYNGNLGFVKQDHTSQSNWLPFTVGTEALYGARPKAVNGVYPYVYNMALEVGMIVEHNGIKYRAIQNANELLFEPSQVPALLTPIKEGE